MSFTSNVTPELLSGSTPDIAVIIPAAGIGARMKSDVPKQYLLLNGKTILEQTIHKFISLSFVKCVVVAISANDDLFCALEISKHPKVVIVDGGKERADSVLSGLKAAHQKNLSWVMVHDAARPCVLQSDIKNLLTQSVQHNCSAILGHPVRDTMKRTHSVQTSNIESTVDRTNLWHAFTPQCCPTELLLSSLKSQLNEYGQLNPIITDESSALELAGHNVLIVESSPKNIKITHPEDLEIAEFYLKSELNEH